MENKLNTDGIPLTFGRCLHKYQMDNIKNIEKYANVPFCHPPDCPFEHIYDNKSETEIQNIEKLFSDLKNNKNKKVKFASVGIVIDIENNVLLTRRNERLNTFPKAWVFAGGQLDKNEDFEDALFREIYEETGIDLHQYEIAFEPILLYESSFPHEFPTSQCLVVFYRLDEVEAYAWVNLDLLKKILFKEDDRSLCLNEFQFNGLEYSRSDHKFLPVKFNQHNFHVRETGEYIPYGHFLACKYL